MNQEANVIHSPVSLYIHLPWCLHKCAYCDFNSHATPANAFPEHAYVAALTNDLRQACRAIQQRPVQSIFIGGGTPSLFSPKSIERIISACHEFTAVDSQCEITLETNPGTFEYQKFADFLHSGVNRLSIGVQSLNDQHLHVLERIHHSDEAVQAIEMAAHIGFENINADLMFGLPGQSIADAKQDIHHLCKYPLTHISYYQLTLEPNTVFYSHPPVLPSDDAIWTMHNNAIEVLHQHGFERYEVSAFAQSNKQCVHNSNYWQFGDYLGIGAGAHTKLTTDNGIIRHQRTRQPQSYIDSVGANSHVLQQYVVDNDSLIFEFMLNNLRLVLGFSADSFTLGTGLAWSQVESKIQTFIDEGLMELCGEYYRASSLGYQFLDELTQRFLPNKKSN